MFLNKRDNNLEIDENILKKNKIPILINYEPWLKMFKNDGSELIKALKIELEEAVLEKRDLERSINSLQSRKPKLMAKIILISNELNEKNNDIAINDLEELKTEMEEINEEIENVFIRLEFLPKIIQEKNEELLKETITYLYENLNFGEERIAEIDRFINQLREQLNKHRIEKEELENRVNNIYHFLHSILGAAEMEKLDKIFLKQ